MTEELVGIIGGSGLGDALAEKISDVELFDIDTPFGKPSTEIMVGKFGKRKIAFLSRHGAGHKLSPSEVPFTANIYALKKLGVRALITSGAVGSLREHIAPADLVIVDQFIDKTYKRDNTFFNGYGAVHSELAEPACSRLRDIIIETAKDINAKTYAKGTYICMEGPQFSTKAESLMHRAWGGDLIGMTALPEAKLAREAQMCYCLIAMSSDYDCWKPHETGINKQTLLQEIRANLQKATNNCLALIEAVLSGSDDLTSDDCACRKSLELAVWTDPGKIEQVKKDQLQLLFE